MDLETETHSAKPFNFDMFQNDQPYMQLFSVISQYSSNSVHCFAS